MLNKVPPPLALSAGAASVTGSGTVVFSNSNGVSFGLNGSTVTASHNGLTAQSSLSFSNTNGVTFGTNGSTLTASVQTNYAGTGLTTTTTTGTVVVGTNSTNGLSLGVPAFLTTAALSQDSSKYAGTGFTTATTAGTNVVGTHNTAGLSLGVPAYLTTAALSQDSSKYAGTGFTTATTTGTNIVGTHNTAGLSLGVPAYLTVAGGGANFSAGASNVGNTSGDTGITGTRLVFAAINNITLSQSTDANGGTISISGATVAGQPINFSAGTTSGNLGSVVFSNSNLVSFGLSGSTITASVPGTSSLSATGVFSISTNGATISMGVGAISAYAVSNTTQSTSGTPSLASLSFAGAGGVSVGVSGGSIVISGGAGAAQTGISGVAASDTTYTSGTISFSNQNNITIGSSVNGATQYIRLSVGNYITTADLSQNSSKYAQNWKLTGNTAGTTSSAFGTDLWIAGGNNITVSGNSNSITISGANAGGAQTGISGVVVSDTTYTSGTVSFSNQNGVTIGSSVNGATQYVRLSVATNYQSQGAYLTTAALSGDTSKYAQAWELTGNTAGTTSSLQGTKIYFEGGNSITVSGNSNTVKFSVGNYLTTAMASNRGSDFVAATAGFNGTNASGTIASNSISVSVAAPGSVGMSTGGNTSGDTGFGTNRLVFAGGANVTLSGSTNGGSMTITVSAGSAAAGSVNFSAGTTSGNLGSVVFSNSNGVSFGLSSSTITASVAGVSISATGAASVSLNASTLSIGVDSVKFYAVGNTFGTSSGTGDLRTMSISGAGNVSVAGSNSGWVISGGTNATADFLENYQMDGLTAGLTASFGLSTLLVAPLNVPQTIQWNQVAMLVSATVPATSCGNTISVSFGTSGQSLQADHFYSFTNSGFYDFYLFSHGASGSSTDLVTLSSTRNSVVTLLNETWRYNATAGNASQTITGSNTVSVGVSYPALTSATSTSVNAATTVTLWGTGYASIGSTASGSITSSKTTGATMSVSMGSTYPAINTLFSGNKFLQFNWGAGSATPGLYYVGVVRGSSTSSSSSSASTSGAAGRSFTTAINMSDLTLTAQLSYVGVTNGVIQTLGTFGSGAAIASLGPQPGLGTFSATYAGSKTFMNNAGQANGEIALSDINTVSTYFKPWYQFANNRV